MKVLHGRIALVTGGSRGIGRSIVTAFSEAGATVAFTYKSSTAETEGLVRELSARGRIIRALQSDAAHAEAAAAAVATVVRLWGRIDILVNNAGVARDGLIVRMSEQDWDTVMENNLKSVFNFTRAASRHMVAQRRGKIVNITSIVGVHGNAGQANYAASKAAIVGFTRSVAKELRSRNIQVNAVAPSFVETGMTAGLTEEQKSAILGFGGRRGIARPEQVAGFVTFLASDDADLITGQTFIAEAAPTEAAPTQG